MLKIEPIDTFKLFVDISTTFIYSVTEPYIRNTQSIVSNSRDIKIVVQAMI
jgi:hypothetical protein